MNRGQPVRRDLPEVPRVRQDLRVYVALQDCKAHRVRPELPVLQVRPALRVHKGSRDRKAHRVRTDRPVLQVRPVLRVYKG